MATAKIRQGDVVRVAIGKWAGAAGRVASVRNGVADVAFLHRLPGTKIVAMYFDDYLTAWQTARDTQKPVAWDVNNNVSRILFPLAYLEKIGSNLKR